MRVEAAGDHWRLFDGVDVWSAERYCVITPALNTELPVLGSNHRSSGAESQMHYSGGQPTCVIQAPNVHVSLALLRTDLVDNSLEKITWGCIYPSINFPSIDVVDCDAQNPAVMRW